MTSVSTSSLVISMYTGIPRPLVTNLILMKFTVVGVFTVDKLAHSVQEWFSTLLVSLGDKWWCMSMGETWVAKVMPPSRSHISWVAEGSISDKERFLSRCPVLFPESALYELSPLFLLDSFRLFFFTFVPANKPFLRLLCPCCRPLPLLFHCRFSPTVVSGLSLTLTEQHPQVFPIMQSYLHAATTYQQAHSTYIISTLVAAEKIHLQTQHTTELFPLHESLNTCLFQITCILSSELFNANTTCTSNLFIRWISQRLTSVISNQQSRARSNWNAETCKSQLTVRLLLHTRPLRRCNNCIVSQWLHAFHHSDALDCLRSGSAVCLSTQLWGK